MDDGLGVIKKKINGIPSSLSITNYGSNDLASGVFEVLSSSIQIHVTVLEIY